MQPLTPLFEQIAHHCSEKQIIKLAQKLAKNFSFTRSQKVMDLCSLAYWLYIFEHKEMALSLCQATNIEIPKKVNYNLWEPLLAIWGLEAYLYEEMGKITEKELKIAQIKEVRSVPNKLRKTKEAKWEFFMRIANRLTFDEICQKDDINWVISQNDKKSELAYRLTALFQMISYGVTGFYPDLERHKAELQTEIKNYIACLK